MKLIFASISVFLFLSLNLNAQGLAYDTTHLSVATPKIIRMIQPGTAPFITIQLSGHYNIGLMDLASADNTSLYVSDFYEGRGFGTRNGFGVSLTGKIRVHKEGNIRLNVTGAFHRIETNFLIPESKFGNVNYNVISGAIGIENCFTPDRKFKPYIGFDIIASSIKGDAVLKLDSVTTNLTIKNSFRIGAGVNFGFEYALNNMFGVNLGMKLQHLNIINKGNKTSSNPNETYLNDDKVTTITPYTGWKQFVFTSISLGFNYYIGQKAKK